MEKVVGIDLGTTFSAISHLDESTGKPEVIRDPDTQMPITASVVMFEDGGNVLVGKVAKENAVAEPQKVVEFVKRSMGKPKGGAAGFEFQGRGAQEISAFILKKLKQDAETRLGQPITKAVITVPAYFGEPQRKATEEAGRIAGFDVLGILDEPVAAALAYGLDRLDKNQTVFVFDLGGGTFDVTIIEIKDKHITELGVEGDDRLGGKDWDDKIIGFLAGEFQSKFGTNPQDDEAAYQDLQLRSIRAKEELTKRDKTRVVVQHAGNSHTVELTRDKFEELTKPLIDRCRDLCDQVLIGAKKTWADVDEILLVGGSTRMPMVAKMVTAISGKTPSTALNPDECVAMGAAWQASILQTQNNGSAAVQELSTKNPALLKKLQDVKVQKITSHALGTIALVDGKERSCLMIPKSTPLPCENSEKFGTVEENQKGVRIQVTWGGLYQSGQECEPDDCQVLGEAVLADIPPHPKGSPIEITYRYNDDGLLEVIGRDVLSGKSIRTEIEHRGGLSAEDMAKAQQNLQRITVSG